MFVHDCVCLWELTACASDSGYTVPPISPSGQKLQNSIGEKKAVFNFRHTSGGLLLSHFVGECEVIGSSDDVSPPVRENGSVFYSDRLYGFKTFTACLPAVTCSRNDLFHLLLGAFCWQEGSHLHLNHVICFFSEPGLKPLVRFLFQLSEQQRNRIQTDHSYSFEA